MPGALIDGFFMLHAPRLFEKEHDDPPPTGTTVQKERPNLTVYDSTVSLGPTMLPNKTYESNIRVYVSGPKDALQDKVLFIHGRFDLTIDGDNHYLRIDSHRLIVIGSEDEIPEGACSNVCLFGRAGVWNEAPRGSQDVYFSLEVSVYLRDHSRTFTIVCRLNRSDPENKRWLKTKAPYPGAFVMVSGFLESSKNCDILVEIETLHYTSSNAAPSGTSPSPQSSGSKKLGTPKRLRVGEYRNVPGTSQSTAVEDVQTSRPLSLLPVPDPSTSGQPVAGPSTPTPAGRTRSTRIRGKKLKTGTETSKATEDVSGGEVSSPDDPDESPSLGKRKASSKKG